MKNLDALAMLVIAIVVSLVTAVVTYQIAEGRIVRSCNQIGAFYSGEYTYKCERRVVIDTGKSPHQ